MSGTGHKMIRFAIVLLLSAVLGCAMTYFSMREQYYTYENPYANYTESSSLSLIMLNASDVKAINKELAGIAPEDYSARLNGYTRSASELSQYAGVLDDVNAGRPVIRSSWKMKDEAVREILDGYSYTVSEALDASRKATVCGQALKYALNSQKFGENVSKRAQILMNSSVFSEETKKKIAKTGADYFRLSEITITAFIPAGIDKLCTNPYMNIFALAAIITCVYLSFVGGKVRKAGIMFDRSKEPVSILILILGLLIGFVLEIVVVNAVFGIGGPHISIQSVPQFKTSQYNLVIWELLVLRVLFRLLSFISLYALSLTLIRSSLPLFVKILIPAVIVASEAFVLRGTAFDLMNGIHFEEIVGKYENFDLFGNTISYAAVFVPEILIVTVCSVILCIRQERKSRQEAANEAEKCYIDDINEKYSQIRIMRHDMNNHLSAALMLLKDGKTEDAMQYLTELTNNMSSLKVISHTGVKALDMLLQNKAAYASEMGIVLNADISADLSEGQISDYELCSVCGNLIDNAFEAVIQLPPDERTVSFTIKKQHEMLCIFCENKYLSVKKENGRYISTKTDTYADDWEAGSRKSPSVPGMEQEFPQTHGIRPESLPTHGIGSESLQEHGLGLKSVMHIAAKHGGTVEINDDNNIFAVSVLIQG
ncbi:MAG: ATP-binding protein [Lachnospiraceae bacterium]|nr:ATP-binding protein [Lachnospiraceae bacterium]